MGARIELDGDVTALIWKEAIRSVIQDGGGDVVSRAAKGATAAALPIRAAWLGVIPDGSTKLGGELHFLMRSTAAFEHRHGEILKDIEGAAAKTWKPTPCVDPHEFSASTHPEYAQRYVPWVETSVSHESKADDGSTMSTPCAVRFEWALVDAERHAFPAGSMPSRCFVDLP